MLLALLAVMSLSTSYQNPVWAKDFPDPFIVRDGDTFYAYATHNSPLGFQIMSSSDLVNWTHLGAVGRPSWSSEQLWAPEVYPWQGKWRMLYSALDPVTKKRDLGISIGNGPRGPFEHQAILVKGVDENEGGGQDGAIDPCLFVENGRPYLLYIREAKPRAVKIVELSADLLKVVGTPRALLLADREIEKGVLDAPTLVRRNGVYWLFYSSGWFQSWKRDACYQVWAARSDTLLGPYKKPDEPLLKTIAGRVYSPGHQTVIELASGEWWMAYHAWDAQGEPLYGHNDRGRTLRLDRLIWKDDGPKVLGPTTDSRAVPRLR